MGKALDASKEPKKYIAEDEEAAEEYSSEHGGVLVFYEEE
jgi:hypothetical protein